MCAYMYGHLHVQYAHHCGRLTMRVDRLWSVCLSVCLSVCMCVHAYVCVPLLGGGLTVVCLVTAVGC